MTLSKELMAEILKAGQLAVIAHSGQQRKGSGNPYVVHPMRVAERLLKHELPAEADLRVMLLAAILHDVLEDTEVPEERLTELFGEDVSLVVRELTQDKSLPKPERRQKMLDGCRTYSLEAKVVKLSDRWDNMSEMASMSADFIERYCREARVMLETMKGAWPAAEDAIQKLIDTHS